MSQPEDMFVCDMEEKDISCPPAWKKLKKSQCTPLFMNAYTMRGESMTGHCLFGDSFIYCSKWNRIGVRQKERDFYLSGRLSDWVEISFSSFPSLDVLPKKKKSLIWPKVNDIIQQLKSGLWLYLLQLSANDWRKHQISK